MLQTDFKTSFSIFLLFSTIRICFGFRASDFEFFLSSLLRRFRSHNGIADFVGD